MEELLSLERQEPKRPTSSGVYSKPQYFEEGLDQFTDNPPSSERSDDLSEYNTVVDHSINDNDGNAGIMKVLILESPAFDSFIRKAQAILEGKLNLGRSLVALSRQLERRIDASIVRFTVDWDPIAFLKSNYDQWSDISIMDTIAVTRSSEHEFQALTCSQYLLQTWPVTEPTIMALLKLLFKDLSLKPESQGILSIQTVALPG